ncbi:succinylglutamate desuccinylase/aspartoacylase family protein [uncultured Methanobrevibacter sp.]|uniref:succinylglutamate desuccinylase/aspartoacylase domain-containing protein n=1 Tax=uncultured Methanobrevibacter sp. TaxID=253161 RepID=UPI0015BECFE6|nr:succinylglutamate desuccinylase/aspartoacylase family protein [uncultured Methanobrevibacter sp.]
MIFDSVVGYDGLEYSYVSKESGGYISRNRNIFNYFHLNRLDQFVLECAVYGTPIFKLGSSGNKILILSGIHGNELSSQIACLKLLNEYVHKEINHTLYFIPFAAPYATMNNDRNYHYSDLNRSAHIKGSLSNRILECVKKLDIDFVGDFHTTALNSNPGCEAVFASKSPTAESYLISEFISKDTESHNIVFPVAGASYKGAIEDECNIMGIPAITGEVLSPFGAVGKGSVERSYNQMKSFSDYFGL